MPSVLVSQVENLVKKSTFSGKNDVTRRDLQKLVKVANMIEVGKM